MDDRGLGQMLAVLGFLPVDMLAKIEKLPMVAMWASNARPALVRFSQLASMLLSP
jgi:hypothetical protein